jgi:hypothetical protein
MNTSLVQLGYCDAHKATAVLSDYLSDEGFTKLAKFIREAGKPIPDKSLTTLGWEPISPEDAAELSLDQHRTTSAPPTDELAF